MPAAPNIFQSAFLSSLDRLQIMKKDITRYIELNNWIFEIKSIRAIRVNTYGEPYSATANLCINNDNAYVDGVMTRDQTDLAQEDYLTFMALCQKLGISKVKFDDFTQQNVFAKLFDNSSVKIA